MHCCPEIRPGGNAFLLLDGKGKEEVKKWGEEWDKKKKMSTYFTSFVMALFGSEVKS